MLDDIILLLGSEFADYPVLAMVVCVICFCIIVNTGFSLIRDVMERVAGYR